MANIHQDGNSIRNIQVVSSNRVHSTHLCEANKCWIFKPLFCLSDKRCLMLIIKTKIEEDKWMPKELKKIGNTALKSNLPIITNF